MNQIHPEQIDRLLEDIASIKTVINSNKPLLKQLLLPIHFRITALIAGLVIIGFSLWYNFLFERYGSYANIPQNLQYISLGLVVMVYLGLVILKRVLWLKSVQRLQHKMTFGQMVKFFYSYQLRHVWIPIFILMIFLIVYLSFVDLERYIVTVVAVGSGIIYNSLGGLVRIRQYLLTGYWLMVTGILPILLPDFSALLLLAFSYGGGMLIFFVTCEFSLDQQGE